MPNGAVVKEVATASRLSILAFSNGFSLWHYKANTAQVTDVAGFFDPVSALLKGGDMIVVSAKDGGRIVTMVEIDGRLDVAPVE